MHIIAANALVRDFNQTGAGDSIQHGTVAVVSDDAETVEHLTPVCAFLDLHVEVVSDTAQLASLLREQQPIAVISDMEGGEWDGFDSMRQVACYDRSLPLLLLTGGNAVMMGAADAMEELWGLSSVTRTSAFPLAGQLVAFLSQAGRRAGSMRLIPV